MRKQVAQCAMVGLLLIAGACGEDSPDTTTDTQTPESVSEGIGPIPFTSYTSAMPDCTPASPAEGVTVVKHELAVVRFFDASVSSTSSSWKGEVQLTNTEVDSTFDCMAALLRTDHDGAGDGDVACWVAFERDGDVKKFDHASNGYIYTQADWNEIMRMPGCIKMVKGIYYCGGSLSCDDANSYWGCGQLPSVTTTGGTIALSGGRKFAVRHSVLKTLWARLWAHEFGHTQGLDHDATNERRLMYEDITWKSARVPKDQAEHFLVSRADDDHCGNTTFDDSGGETGTCAPEGGE